MNKKKIITLLISGSLAIGLIGGTLAWYTSSDNVNNAFSTSGEEDHEGADIVVEENFDGDEFRDGQKPDNKIVDKVYPGDTVDKEVWVKNTNNYSQLVRVKITKSWENEDLDPNDIVLKFNSSVGNQYTEGNWVLGSDGYYYYMGRLDAKGDKTSQILDSVKLAASEKNNDEKSYKFNVLVEAESVQAKNDAFKDTWNLDPEEDADLISALDGFELE